MITTQLMESAPGLVFDVSVAGPADGPLVLMLHGFGVSRYLWNAQVEGLAQAGYRTAAPTRWGSTPRWRCRMASKSAAPATSRGSSTRKPARTFWLMTRNGSAPACRRTASRPRRYGGTCRRSSCHLLHASIKSFAPQSQRIVAFKNTRRPVLYHGRNRRRVRFGTTPAAGDVAGSGNRRLSHQIGWCRPVVIRRTSGWLSLIRTLFSMRATTLGSISSNDRFDRCHAAP